MKRRQFVSGAIGATGSIAVAPLTISADSADHAATLHQENSSMPLTMKPFGIYRVYPGPSSQHPGPVAFRSASRLDRAEWHNDLFGETRFLFGMGSYLHGQGGAHVTIRAEFETADNVRFFLEYNSRGNMETHSIGKTPVILAGYIDIDPANPKYAWLNHTQIVGRGMLTKDPLVQTYEMYVLI